MATSEWVIDPDGSLIVEGMSAEQLHEVAGDLLPEPTFPSIEAYRDQWGEGPWQHEGDREQYEHAGLTCLLRRAYNGAWCGYVGVPRGHWAFGVRAEKLARVLRVHGGVNYSEACDDDPINGVCHVAPLGQDDLWWIGWSATSVGEDYVPMYAHWSRFMRAHGAARYLPVWAARAETLRLAAQLAR